MISNILPAEVRSIVVDYNEGRYSKAKDDFYKLLPLCRAMFVETNPIPIKSAMVMLGHCSPEIRLPLLELAGSNKEILRQAMLDYGLLK